MLIYPPFKRTLTATFLCLTLSGTGVLPVYAGPVENCTNAEALYDRDKLKDAVLLLNANLSLPAATQAELDQTFRRAAPVDWRERSKKSPMVAPLAKTPPANKGGAGATLASAGADASKPAPSAGSTAATTTAASGLPPSTTSVSSAASASTGSAGTQSATSAAPGSAVTTSSTAAAGSSDTASSGSAATPNVASAPAQPPGSQPTNAQAAAAQAPDKQVIATVSLVPKAPAAEPYELPFTQYCHLFRALCYLQGKELDHAAADADFVLKANPSSVDAHLVRAWICRDKKDPNSGLADLDFSQKQEPRNPAVYMLRGCLFHQLKNDSNALKQFDIALSINRNYYPVYFSRANLYIDTHDADRAKEDLKKCLNLKPNDAEARKQLDLLSTSATVTEKTTGRHALILKCEAGLNMSDPATTLNEANIAVQRNPNDPLKYVARARANSRNRNYDACNADIATALRLDPRCAEAYIVRASVNNRNQQYEAALQEVQTAISLAPNSEGYAYRGDILARMKRHQESLADYSRALALIGKEPIGAETSFNTWYLYFSRGSEYGDLGMMPQAVADYNTAIKINDKDERVYVNRGKALGAMGQFQPALADINHALSINPKSWLGYSARSFVYSRMGYNAQAIKDKELANEIRASMPPPPGAPPGTLPRN